MHKIHFILSSKNSLTYSPLPYNQIYSWNLKQKALKVLTFFSVIVRGSNVEDKQSGYHLGLPCLLPWRYLQT